MIKGFLSVDPNIAWAKFHTMAEVAAARDIDFDGALKELC